MNVPLSSEEAFLAEGLQVYFDACVALRSFRQRVYVVCSQVLLEHREKLVAVGFGWGSGEPKSAAYPDALDDRKWEDEGPVLCVRVSAQSLGHFYVGVYWARNEEGGMATGVYAGLEFGSAATRERVWKELAAVGGARMEKDPDLYEIYVTREVEPPSESSLVEKLGEVLSVWEGLLKKAGGLEGLSKVAGGRVRSRADS